ncbi:MAG: phage protein Gp36 family protein [Burkholderia gladioli]
MSYASPADLQIRYLERDLIALTDETNQAVDVSKLQLSLTDATAEIDGYLAMRYVLPLVDAVLLTPLSTPAVLQRACCDIAVYRLQTLRPHDDVKDARLRYEDCIKVLKLISVGDVQLVGAKLKPGQAVDPKDAAQSPGMPQFDCDRGDPFSRRYR